MPIRCQSCGHGNRQTAKFCGNCAAALELIVSCGACGAPNPPGQRFCDACGRSVVESTAPTSSARPAGQRPPTALPPSLGSERYRVTRFLGEGAKKRVYLARDQRLERDVAIALIKTDNLDEAGLARVRREARAMGRLADHPNVVTVYDVGDEDGQPYIISQYMSGGSVSELLERAEKRRLPIEHAVRVADHICRALEYAHAREIIHRDLKPENVWLSEDGTAKLGDFGLALALDRSRITLEGMMVGTVAYMPPEQALGRAPERRSDLYALGAMLYEMVTGRPPFLGDDAVSIISQHINTPPVAPSWHNPDVPRALEALILRLLAKTPEDRPESATTVQQALAAIATVRPASVDSAVSEEANPLDRLASGVFVGREREMDELRAALEDTLSGWGRLVMLVGEPGIGKTRTAEELITYARLRKAQVLWGRCYEGEGAPAYWPWVQAIRSYVHDRDPQALLSELGSGASVIGQVVSEIRDRLPGLHAPQALNPDEARFRLFDSITTFLKNAAKAQAMVLVLDDLHWADKSSLLLLQFVARELRGTRMLVLGTYRDADLRRQHPLAQTLGELTREQLAHRILLRGLSEHDVCRFIEVTTGFRPPDVLVNRVFKETEGNPFFVNEVVRLLASDGRLEHPENVKSWSVSIPQGVREVIGRRLDRLSAECNRALTTAAVIGREFGVDVLERVSELAGDRLLEVLEEALAARVIVEIPRAVGRYTFAHALIRETLYEELTTTRRVRLHRQVGEVLETLYGAHPEPHLAELAYHFFEAAQGGDVDRAIAYALRAGDRAADLLAHEEAARHYELALQALDLREHSDPGRCAMMLTLCETLWRAGEYDRAQKTALRAAEIARQRGDAESLARAALGYGGKLVAFAAVIRDDTLIGLLEEALAALGDAESPLRACILGRLAEEVTFSDPYERREALCREAIAIARRADDPIVLARVLRGAHWALWTADNLEERRALADEIIELADGAGDRVMAVEGHAFRLWDLIESGDIVAAGHEFELAGRLAEETRQPYLCWAFAITRVTIAFVHGWLGEIENLAQRALQMGQETQNQNATLVFGIQMLLLYRDLGRQDELEPLLAGFTQTYPSIALPVRCALALTWAEQGRMAEARAEFERLAADDFPLPRDVALLFSYAYLAETCAKLGDAERARTLYERLLPTVEHIVTIGPVVAQGAVSRYCGLLAATMGRPDDAARLFEKSLDFDLRIGTRQAAARTQIAYAELLLAEGRPADRGKAIELLNGALEIAGDLGMKLVMQQALALKLRAQGVTAASAAVSIDAVAAAVERERPDLRPHAAPDGTVTILFTDIEGSSAMTERLGDRRAQQVLHTHNRIVREQVATYGGFEVKAMGDGFMIAFQSASRALRCAIALQRAFAAFASQRPDEAIRVRIGLHTGETIKEGDDFFGRAVILAARVAASAGGGEILVSALLRELTESAGEFQFRNGRDFEFKGLGGRHQLYHVSWQ